MRHHSTTLGHRGSTSVAGYTKITGQHRSETYEQSQRRGCGRVWRLGSVYL